MLDITKGDISEEFDNHEKNSVDNSDFQKEDSEINSSLCANVDTDTLNNQVSDTVEEVKHNISLLEPTQHTVKVCNNFEEDETLGGFTKPEEKYDPESFPISYRRNLPKENVALQYARNFQRQFTHLYRDRKPLFMIPRNECDVEKFVSTTVRPTKLPYLDLYDWDGAAEFVADYLNFVALDPPYCLSERLVSPETTLKRQWGNCFDYANLLCSLLIGTGYDAYIVSGYATREICRMDRRREACPLLKKKEEGTPTVKEKVIKKYTVKPAKDLQSKYILRMDEMKRIEREQEREKLEEAARLADVEKPAPDKLYGLRIHAWVLVLPGKREVAEGFFVEPLTGVAYPLTSSSFLGIESVWNHQNYWVNMQDCSEGVQNVNYDLSDCTYWEYVFPRGEKNGVQIIDAAEDMGYEEEETLTDDVEKYFDLPPSWSLPISLSREDYNCRCPHGKKVILYKKVRLEKFVDYLCSDGLSQRLTVYLDKDLTEPVTIQEKFNFREDRLLEKTHNLTSSWITERFSPGRKRKLLEHTYRDANITVENERTMFFEDEARTDGLMRRVETPELMSEFFKDRDDYLHFRETTYGRRLCSLEDDEKKYRPIKKIVLKFKRNPAISANEDVEEETFLISEDRIILIYHTDDSKISSSTREFNKPSGSDDKGSALVMGPDTHHTFQVDPNVRDIKEVQVYQTLVNLIRSEEEVIRRVRESEMEVLDILSDRKNETENPVLHISEYDTIRNDKARRKRKDMERQLLEEQKRRQEMEMDCLAPFLADLGNPEKLTYEQALKLRDDCLANLKERLVDMANLIQARFEKETKVLQEKQQWYQQNQISMTKEDEEEYTNYCTEAMFRIHILVTRLNRHKATAPAKYMDIEQKIRNDPRLERFFR